MSIGREEFGKLHEVRLMTEEEKRDVKKTKSINLLLEKLEDFTWRIKVRVKGNGTFGGVGLIEVQDCKTNYENNKEKHKQRTARWRKRNPRKMCGYTKKWQEKDPVTYRKTYTRTNAKRHRELGFEPINEPFEGAHAHHMTKDIVVYIPAELHRSVCHNVFTGEGMDEINGKVLVWLGKQDRIKEVESNG